MNTPGPRASAGIVRSALDKTPWAEKLLEMADERRRPLYLVGGFVRDALLERIGVLDIDLACAPDTAAAAAAHWGEIIQGSVFPLDPTRGTYRVAKRKDGKLWYWDFTDFRGPDIRADLIKRDFTINAMALPLWPAGEGFLDPTGGLEDLAAGIIRHTNPMSFDEDPLRKLRVYRFAAMLKFTPARETASLLKGTDLTAVVAGERIREEMTALISAGGSGEYLGEIYKTGLLSSLMPTGGPDTARLQRLEELLAPGAAPTRVPLTLTRFLADESTHGLTYESLLKIISLALPRGPINPESPTTARLCLNRWQQTLRLGRGAAKFQNRCLSALQTLREHPDLLSSPEGPWSYFDSYGEAGLGALILQAAMDENGGISGETLPVEPAAFFYGTYLPDLESEELLPAGEVVTLTGPITGETLGGILLRLKMARRLGRITSSADAREYLLKLLETGNPPPPGSVT
jgi:poly(A) polymerase